MVAASVTLGVLGGLAGGLGFVVWAISAGNALAVWALVRSAWSDGRIDGLLELARRD